VIVCVREAADERRRGNGARFQAALLALSNEAGLLAQQQGAFEGKASQRLRAAAARNVGAR
jgi:hypothetical protein